MSAGISAGFAGLELTDDRYTVEQSLVRSKYRAYDSTGATVLTTREKRFSIKDRFPFKDGDGNDVFEVVSASMLDFDRKRDYVVVDAQTDEEVVVLDEQFSIFSHRWSIRDPATGDVVATIESQNKAVFALRGWLGVVGKMLPHRYDILAADGSQVGTIEGRLSLNDVYDVEVRSDYEGPREAIIATAMIIDAIEGN